jgi:hypothetical protein
MLTVVDVKVFPMCAVDANEFISVSFLNTTATTRFQTELSSLACSVLNDSSE